MMKFKKKFKKEGSSDEMCWARHVVVLERENKKNSCVVQGPKEKKFCGTWLLLSTPPSSTAAPPHTSLFTTPPPHLGVAAISPAYTHPQTPYPSFPPSLPLYFCSVSASIHHSRRNTYVDTETQTQLDTDIHRQIPRQDHHAQVDVQTHADA